MLADQLDRQHDSDRARRLAERIESHMSELRQQVLDACAPGREQQAAEVGASLRARCADLALRATGAAVALYKGSALLEDHPAQRLARETLFLLVWSCPDPVIDCTVDLLSHA
jgi:alkylation response protein AidB-like acyl-CoA dehydrogenase